MAGGVMKTDAALEAAIRRRGQESLELARQVLRSGPWRFESRTAGGDELHSCSVAGVGRVLMFTGLFNCSALTMQKILIDGVEEYPTWSSVYVKDSCRRVMMLDSNTDMTLLVTSPRLGGLVSARDWLSVRHWREGPDEQGVPEMLSAGVAVQHPDIPPGKGGIVRGESLLGAYAIAEAPPSPETAKPRCRLRFLFSVRLGGWLPQSIVQRFMDKGVIDFTSHLRQRVDSGEP